MRPSRQERMLRLAEEVALSGTCARRRVGCVLVDRAGKILATGYNGPPRGFPHCTETPCPGADQPAGQSEGTRGTLLCESPHAEINALIQCSDAEAIREIYLTCSPCWSCTLALLNTEAGLLVFREMHHTWERSGALWRRGRRDWIHLRWPDADEA